MLKSNLKHSTLASPVHTMSPIVSSREEEERKKGMSSLGSSKGAKPHLTAKAKLVQKYKGSPYYSPEVEEAKAMKHFCAAKIQALYKMSLTRRLVKYHRFPMYHIAAIQIQWAWRSYRQRVELLRPKRSP